tara:strand:- start:300 stop:647 length:348 start_codon:yes stop_codon:yes gene_type:complete
MYNKVFLIGRLVKDPDSRVTTSGISLTRFTIAIDRPGKKENAVTDFINIVTWRKTAEIANQFLKKGKLVSIEGTLRIDNYDKDGQSRQWIEVVADNFQMLDKISDETRSSEEVLS